LPGAGITFISQINTANKGPLMEVFWGALVRRNDEKEEMVLARAGQHLTQNHQLNLSAGFSDLLDLVV
jgi:hypothetical protein